MSLPVSSVSPATSELPTNKARASDPSHPVGNTIIAGVPFGTGGVWKEKALRMTLASGYESVSSGKIARQESGLLVARRARSGTLDLASRRWSCIAGMRNKKLINSAKEEAMVPLQSSRHRLNESNLIRGCNFLQSCGSRSRCCSHLLEDNVLFILAFLRRTLFDMFSRKGVVQSNQGGSNKQ